MKTDLDVKSTKVEAMVKFHITNPDQLHTIGKRYKKGFRVNKDFRERYDLTDQEKADFQERLTEELITKGIIQND